MDPGQVIEDGTIELYFTYRVSKIHTEVWMQLRRLWKKYITLIFRPHYLRKSVDLSSQLCPLYQSHLRRGHVIHYLMFPDLYLHNTTTRGTIPLPVSGWDGDGCFESARL